MGDDEMIRFWIVIPTLFGLICICCALFITLSVRKVKKDKADWNTNNMIKTTGTPGAATHTTKGYDSTDPGAHESNNTIGVEDEFIVEDDSDEGGTKGQSPRGGKGMHKYTQ